MAKYFSDQEVACSCGECASAMQPDFMAKLDALREHLGFPLYLSSAYRCPNYNNSVSTTGYDGPHTTGRAVDIRISGEKAFMVLENAPFYGFTGIGVAQKGPHGARFIHLDDLQGRNRPWVWSY